MSNQNVEQSVIYVKVLTNTKTQTFVLNKYNFEWPRSVFRMPTDFMISLLLLSDLDEPLGKIGTSLEHQGTRGTTKIRLKGNLFYEPDIRIKKHTKNSNKCRENEIKH